MPYNPDGKRKVKSLTGRPPIVPKQFERDMTDTGVGADEYALDSEEQAKKRRRASMMEDTWLAPKQKLPSDSIFNKKKY